MSTTFDEIAEDLFDDDDFCVDATFTPSVGDTVWCRINLEIATEVQPAGLDAQVWGSQTTIEYRLDEVGKEADRGETFTVEGTVYTVKDIMENDGRFVKVSVA